MVATIWGEIQRAAEQAYDRTSACRFTSFVGYEWTGATKVSNYHRNVVFRDHHVPELPTSYFEAPTAEQLWDALDASCTGDCEALVIPHNPNLSNGNMFPPEPEQAEHEVCEVLTDASLFVENCLDRRLVVRHAPAVLEAFQQGASDLADLCTRRLVPLNRQVPCQPLQVFGALDGASEGREVDQGTQLGGIRAVGAVPESAL